MTPELEADLDNNDKVINENNTNNRVYYSDDVINILLMGIDNGGPSYPYGRSDAMIVASINKKTKSIKFVSLSRTAYVSIAGYSNTRLNHAHGYGGPALAIDTIERNYKIRIDNYISTTFDAFKELIDAMGGVNIKLTEEEIANDSIRYALSMQGYKGQLNAGTYSLDGASALTYVRLRSIDSDRDRTQRQRNLLMSVASKAKTMSLTEINSVINKILPFITTDLTKTDIITQTMNVPTYLSSSIKQYVLPHESSELKVINDFEVVLVNWTKEVEYARKVFYTGVEEKYETR
jgi:LCP family protein required for cell wall assembly